MQRPRTRTRHDDVRTRTDEKPPLDGRYARVWKLRDGRYAQEEGPQEAGSGEEGQEEEPPSVGVKVAGYEDVARRLRASEAFSYFARRW